MESSSKFQFKFLYRLAAALMVAIPLLVYFYYSFLYPEGHIDPQEMELRTALFYLLSAYSLGAIYTYAAGELTLIGFAALGPAMYFAFPKYIILTLYPEDIVNLSPQSTQATNLFLESWAMVFVTYVGCRALMRLMVDEKKFSLENAKRFIAPPIPQVAWNAAFVSFIVSGFLQIAIAPHIRTAAAVCILATRPPKQYIPPVFTSLVVVAMCLYDFLEFGFISTGFAASFLILFSGFTSRNKINIITGVLAIVTFSYVQICKYEYRSLLNANPNMKLEEKAKIIEFWLIFRLAMAADENVLQQDENQPSLIVRVLTGGLTDKGVLGRIHEDSLERVLEYVPHRVPFWDGRTLKRLPYLFIPRSIWAEKPGRDHMNEFGRTFGYLADDDYETSISCNLLAEGFLNYGYDGIYAFSILFALITVILEIFSKFFLKEINTVALLSFSAMYIGPMDADALVSSFILLTTGLVLLNVLFLRRYSQQRLPTQVDPYVDAA